MLFKLRPCIQILCNVYYPPTPEKKSLKIVNCAKSWLDRTNKASSSTIGGLTLLVPHKRLIWQPCLSQPTMETYVTLPIISHPCPPKTHRHGWAWVWAPNVVLYSTVYARMQGDSKPWHCHMIAFWWQWHTNWPTFHPQPTCNGVDCA